MKIAFGFILVESVILMTVLGLRKKDGSVIDSELLGSSFNLNPKITKKHIINKQKSAHWAGTVRAARFACEFEGT